MTPARLQTIEEIFHAALDQEPDQISAFLDRACEGDELLRGRVEELVASYQQAGSFIETSAVGLTTKIIQNGQGDLLVGRTIGHYKISERIGTGGMGEVYLATDITAGRKAALKLLPTRFTSNPERLKRFQQEARAVVGLNHPNIVTVYEIGDDQSTHYIASELIDGETLRQRLARGPMGMDEAVDVAIQVASALAAAHEAGVVHRDIKPENIMVRPDGYVKVLDFGIAKLAESAFADQPSRKATARREATPKAFASKRADGAEPMTVAETHLGSILGTVRYMSPEQALGAPVDKRTDIWSLGVVLYEMVAGRRPFTGDTLHEVMNSTLTAEPAPLTNYVAQTPGELQRIVTTALCKEREKRYQSAHELLDGLKSLRSEMEFKERSTAAPFWLRWTRSPATLVLVMLIGALAFAFPFYWHRNPTRSSIPEKSIAVLPFENFSDNKENSYFAAGMQDDVLTSLAQIRELKVISRTSVMAYQKPSGRNMRQISQALGVANVLEGSVRRAGDRVLINVQLIDTRTDRHLWAERYDRAVADSIGLQGELANEIAAALKAQLAPEEKVSLERKPTDNPEAYALYLQARGREGAPNRSNDHDSATEQLYAQAIALDPKFALAHARRSILDSRLAADTGAETLRAQARIEAQEAFRLTPSLGEAHTALGLSLYWGDKDYAAALKEFSIAAATSPNEPDILTYIAGIYRRQGRWRESLAAFQRAQELDPRNRQIASLAAFNHLLVRDWPAAGAPYNRALEIAPDSASPKIGLAYLEVFQHNSPAAGRHILQSIPPGLDPDGEVTEARWDLAILERDYAGAERILAESSLKHFARYEAAPLTFYQGRTAFARGDVESAQRYFAAAAPGIEERVRENPGDADRHALLSLLYAYMQRKENALREGHRAVELEPESQDAFHGAQWVANLALVYALVGEQDQAITLIERLLSTPGPIQWPDHPMTITLADLRLRWEWDSLRSNPRFQKILAGPEPKTVY